MFLQYYYNNSVVSIDRMMDVASNAKRLSISMYHCERLKPVSQLRFDYDTTMTRLRRKIDMLIFCLRRMEAGACDTS